MVIHKVVAAVVAALALLMVPCEAKSQLISEPFGLFDALFSSAVLPAREGYYYAPGIRKFFNSFTSYQFPNPFSPGQDPLSRLEFPIDQWFAGLQAGCESRYWALDGQVWVNATRESAKRMQDSDWDDETLPFQKTIFSESHCRLNRGLLGDIKVAFATPLDGIINFGNLWPVVGYRYQQFYFTTHDGEQTELGGSSGSLEGDGIDFEQTFHQLYLGARAKCSLDSLLSAWLPAEATLEAQFDYALVRGKNEDLHLLREGDRLTTERTSGHCWHGSAALVIAAPNNMLARIEADFKRSMTNGAHQLTNSVFDIDFSFSGSRVWSDQLSLWLALQLTL
ncbi:MAG: omptin family outer membrane protease [Desulfomonile tiedjei]|nr:omptin family outer membrane protease [Desulfomonile tiedjei]